MISHGQICDDKCTIVLDEKKLNTIKSKDIKINMKEKDIIMRGTRNHRDGLYDIPIEKTVMQENNYLEPKSHMFPSLNLISTQKFVSVTKKQELYKKERN